MRRTTIAAGPVALLLALPACTASPGPATDARGPLRATLTTPTDIDLSWRDDRPQVAGHVLEFATAPGGPYTALRYLPTRTTTYRHPDLMPRTTFHYRLVSYRGPASPPVTVEVPAADRAPDLAGQKWLTPRDRPGAGAGQRRSLRGAEPGTAPTGFTAEPRDAGGIAFTWTDNSRDEDGFLLEIRRAPGAAFDPVMVMDPDTDATGLVTLPGEEHADYRVRAFVFGEKSDTVRLTTGE
ncbi:fibronectin type III domain-containing protein [Streptomyces sp. NPDC048290]|uniref:fibronectin type III domain-containing protein n=1 Tax=Streptomyces sp. NPDC048290 TaxID=3155811 RepID=UPI00342C04F6